jgi:hypothetical protein
MPQKVLLFIGTAVGTSDLTLQDNISMPKFVGDQTVSLADLEPFRFVGILSAAPTILENVCGPINDIK